MPYGLRFVTYSQNLGSRFDWFVPDQDMPDAYNKKGYKVFQDIIETPFGNSFLYDKGKHKTWTLDFKDISTLSKDRLEHISFGWLGSRQITMVYFGTSVTGTTTSQGSMSTAGQLWGTGYCQITSTPEEVAFGLWNVSLEINEFGGGQTFS